MSINECLRILGWSGRLGASFSAPKWKEDSKPFYSKNLQLSKRQTFLL